MLCSLVLFFQVESFDQVSLVELEEGTALETADQHEVAEIRELIRKLNELFGF